MSGRGGHKDKRIKHVMAFLLWCQGCRRGAGILLPPSWHCCPHRGGVVIVNVQASLPLLGWCCCPCRDGVFAIVDDDGDGATGNDNDDDANDNGATGNNDNDDRDGATDDKVDNNYGNGAMEDDVDNDCDGATGNNDNNNNPTDNAIDDDGNGTTDDNVDNDNGDRMTNGDRTADDDVDVDGYDTTDEDIDDDCDGATDGCHCLDACGGCATKGDARRRHATTGKATTSRQTRCK
jgi:hypothetical protein